MNFNDDIHTLKNSDMNPIVLQPFFFMTIKVSLIMSNICLRHYNNQNIPVLLTFIIVRLI